MDSHKSIIESFPVGYAYHKIILDENNRPCDYEFIEVNIVFENFTGLKRSDILGKNISEVLPDIKKSEFNWIEVYGNIAINGGSEEFEQFSEPLKRWYKVKVYSLEEGTFITAFTDITKQKETEEKLRKSEELNRAVVSHAPVGLFRFSMSPEKEMKFPYMSHTMERLLRVSKEEVLNDYFILNEKINPGHRERFNKAIEKSAVTLKPFQEVILIDLGEGEEIWLEVRSIPKKQEDGSILWTGVFIDVDQQKRNQEALKESEQELKTITDNMSDLVIITDTEGIATFLSGNYFKLLGYKEEELLGRSVFEVVCPDDVEKISTLFRKHIAMGKSGMAEYRFVRKDGSLVWVETIGSIVHENGSMRGGLFVSRDITERKRIEEELIKKQEELDTYFTSSLDMLCIANTNGEFVRLNPEWQDVLGYPMEELEGSVFLDYVHPDDLEATLDAIKDLKSQQEVTSFTNRYRCSDGSYRWIEWRSKPINQMIYSVARDITEHIELQKTLSDREERYRILAENVADVVWTTDLEFNITWVSPSVYQLIGETPEEHMATNIKKRFSQNDLIKLNNLLHQQLLLEEDPKSDKKRSVEIELQHRKKDGTSVWTSMKMTFLRDGQGKPIGIHGVTRDISERVERDHALKEQNYRQEILLSASEKLINATPENLSSVINSTLSEVAKISVADRVYLFEYDFDREVTNNIYEWCDEGITAQKDKSQNIPLSECKELLYYHRKGESIVIKDVQALPEGDSLREILEPQAIKSLLSVPLFSEGELFGFVGFDSVRKHHFYTKEEHSLLHQFANNVAITIKKDSYTSKLRRTEANLKEAHHMAMLGRWDLYHDENRLQWTETIFEIFEIDSEDFGASYEAFLAAIHPEDRIAVEAAWKRSLVDKKPYHIEHRLLMDDGRIKWVYEQCRTEFDGKGHPIQSIGIVQDITDRKEMEQQLKKSQLSLKIATEGTGTGIWDWDMVNDSVTYSIQWKKILGYEDYEVENAFSGWKNLWHPDDATRIEKSINDYLAGKTEKYEIIHRCRHKDGDWRWIVTRGTILKDNNNKPYRWVGTNVDITKIKQAEDQLFQEKEQFKTTLLSVGDGIISTDKKGNVLILNPISEQLTGWTQEEAMGRSSDEVFHIINEFTRESCDNPVQKVIETGEIVELANHTLLISKDGFERPIQDSAAPIKDEQGNITGVVLVFRDFTEKKKSQDEITYLSFHDHLTGVYNRRFFEVEMERLDTERNLPITIIMGDVNGLKLINDSLGHSVGDELLIKTAKTLKKSFRAEDIIARVGGDEYVILLPKTDVLEAKELIKRVKRNLKNDRVRDLDVSVSFGWGTKTDVTESIALVLKKAEDYMYNNKLFEGPSVRGKVIENIMATINAKNIREEVHSNRVSMLCVAIGQALEIEEKDINKLKVLGLFHDIGKIAIVDDILNKPDKLTEEEYKEIMRHPEIGYRILSTANDMSEIADYVLSHHERWDGKGYPRGLTGETIPLPSRICAIADAYDAMTSDRSYRPAMTNEFAVEELQKNAGTQFDSELVDVFVEKVIPTLSNGYN